MKVSHREFKADFKKFSGQLPALLTKNGSDLVLGHSFVSCLAGQVSSAEEEILDYNM